MLEPRIARSAGGSKGVSPALGAIAQALSMIGRLPESEQVRELRNGCLACQHIVQNWAHGSPTPEEREDLMKRVLALQVLVTRAYRSCYPQPAP